MPSKACRLGRSRNQEETRPIFPHIFPSSLAWVPHDRMWRSNQKGEEEGNTGFRYLSERLRGFPDYDSFGDEHSPRSTPTRMDMYRVVSLLIFLG